MTQDLQDEIRFIGYGKITYNEEKMKKFILMLLLLFLYTFCITAQVTDTIREDLRPIEVLMPYNGTIDLPIQSNNILETNLKPRITEIRGRLGPCIVDTLTIDSLIEQGMLLKVNNKIIEDKEDIRFFLKNDIKDIGKGKFYSSKDAMKKWKIKSKAGILFFRRKGYYNK
ncbi:hypothetical protein [Sinomicrobium sp. M5D2P17]